jgi:hypothetical protein
MSASNRQCGAMTLRVPSVGDTVDYHGSQVEHHGKATVIGVRGRAGWTWFSIRTAAGVRLHHVRETSVTRVAQGGA